MSPPAPRPPAPSADRRRVISGAALVVLAEQGARGLTHRRVDSQAGLPIGSTSNVFRSRNALLEGALDHLIEVDFPEPDQAIPASLTVDDAAQLVAAQIERWVEPQVRYLLLARYELLLEASRQIAFAEVLSRRRAGVLRLARKIVEALGLPDPETRAMNLMLWVDGYLFDDILDPESALDTAALRKMAALQLAG